MDFSQIGIKKFLSLVVIILLNQNLTAQNEAVSYRYEIEILNQDYLNVKVFRTQNTSFPLVFKFSNQVPNFYIKERVLNEVSDFYITINGQKQKLNILQEVFEINQTFDFINYKVKFKDLEPNDFPAVQTFSRNDYMLINFANFLAGLEEDLVEVKIIKENQIVFHDTKTLKDFYSAPVCIGCAKKKFDDKDLSLEVYFNRNEDQFLKYVSEALDAYKILGFEEKLENKMMIFVLDSINNNEGAIAHQNHIIFNFKELNKYQIQKTILHEMIHWVVPDLQSWLNESVAEFLAIKLLMKSGLISDEKFLEIMADKMKTADRFKIYSLDDLFRNKTELSIKQDYQALYSKGAVLAFVLDAKLFNNPYIDISLEQYVLSGISGKNEKLSIEFIQDLVEFEEEYAIIFKSFSYNIFLNQWGLLYEENKVLEIKAKQRILLVEEDGNIIITDNGGVNQLEENDVLLKLDGAAEIEEIREKLMEKSEKISCFVVLREGNKKNLKIKNKESLFIRSKFNLSFFEDRTKDQKDNWKKYIY